MTVQMSQSQVDELLAEANPGPTDTNRVTMRKRDVAIFFSIVLSVYAAINGYVFVHGFSAIEEFPDLKPLYVALFVFLSFSFLAGRILERRGFFVFGGTLVWIGSFWLAAMVYFLLVAVSLDLALLLDQLIHVLPGPETLIRLKHFTFVFATGAVTLVVAGGHLNAIHPVITPLELHIRKNTGGLKRLQVVVASDIHLGTIVCRSRLEHIVSAINRLQPDLVLLPGDVVDEDLGPVIEQNLGETLRKIQSKFGVIAVTGNHEYIGGVEAACGYLRDHGITVLRDSTIKIADSLYVVGREDLSFARSTGKRRKTLPELLAGVDKELPLILMDHQPFRLNEAEENGIDLQLSGHTHHGQLWPFNFITKKVYELSRGYMKKGNTHVYVSCGVGTWGPPVRTGNRPEIVHLQLSFA